MTAAGQGTLRGFNCMHMISQTQMNPHFVESAPVVPRSMMGYVAEFEVHNVVEYIRYSAKFFVLLRNGGEVGSGGHIITPLTRP